MGRLSEYMNGYRGRSVYIDNAPKASSGSASDYVQVTGVEENMKMLEEIMMSDKEMERNVRKMIRQILREARKKLSQDARNYMDQDPRKAYKAVKFTVYKQAFGGTLSILQKRKGTGTTYSLMQKEHTSKKRGGNRRPFVNDNRNRLYKYMGADRGFVLRFIASGTITRRTRYGNRGSIKQTNWFGHTAPWHMEAAATEVADAINEFIKSETNG